MTRSLESGLRLSPLVEAVLIVALTNAWAMVLEEAFRLLFPDLPPVVTYILFATSLTLAAYFLLKKL